MIPAPFASVLLAVFVGAPQQALAPDRHDDIVVTAHTLASDQRALAACLARHCPPDQDIDASLAVAETEFVAGKYHDARTTLLASIHRNKRYASRYPVAVSDLLRANARIAGHLGEGDAQRIGMIDVVSALKAGLNDDDARVLEAKVELADTYVRFGRINEAADVYKEVRDKAKKLRIPRVQGFAMLHLASLYQKLAARRPSAYRAKARDAIGDLTRATDPHMATFALAGRVLKAQMTANAGDDGAINDLVAMLPKTDRAPVLLYAPAPEFPDESGRDKNSGDVLTKLATKDFENQWVDIGFWIGPEGRVTDADILRHSNEFEGDWPKPLVAAIEQRRYAPTKRGPEASSTFRVERYTYTSRWTHVTGSRMRQRSARPDIEMLDLTASANPATASGG